MYDYSIVFKTPPRYASFRRNRANPHGYCKPTWLASKLILVGNLASKAIAQRGAARNFREWF